MNFKKLIGSTLILFCGFMLAHCSKPLPPGDYDTAEVGQVKKVVSGTIVSIREVRLHNKSAESISSDGRGAMESNEADNSMNKSHGFEYVIRLNSGGIISVVQAEKIKLKPKQRVLVIYGGNTRVVPDTGSED